MNGLLTKDAVVEGVTDIILAFAEADGKEPSEVHVKAAMMYLTETFGDDFEDIRILANPSLRYVRKRDICDSLRGLRQQVKSLCNGTICLLHCLSERDGIRRYRDEV